jgi:hypothetical protein
MNKTLKIAQSIILIVGAVAAPFILFIDIAYRFLHDHDGANVIGGIVWAIYLYALIKEYQSITDRRRKGATI